MKYIPKLSFIFTTFLLLSSASGLFAGEIGADALGDAAADSLGKSLRETFEEAGAKVESDAAKNLTESLQKSLKDLANKGATEEELKAASESMTKSMKESLDNIAKGLKDGEDIAYKFNGMEAGDLNKISDDVFKDSMSKTALSDSLKGALEKKFPGITKGKLDLEVADDVEQVDEIKDELSSENESTAESATETAGDAATESGEGVAKSRFSKFKDALKDIKENPGKNAKAAALSVGKTLGGVGLKVGETIAMAILFMVPNVVQSSVEAEEARKAALATLTKPIQFGDWVVQIVTSCVNQDHPSQSIPVYVAIPAANVTSSIPSSGETVTDLSKLSSGDNIAKSFGVTGPTGGKFAYTPTKFLPQTRILVSYPAQSFDSPCSAAITDPNFSQMLISLNDGYVIDATGEQTSASPVALIPRSTDSSNAPKPVSSMLPGIYSKLDLASSITTAPSGYTMKEALTLGLVKSKDSSGVNPDSILLQMFDCDQTTGLPRATATNAVKGLLNQALGDYDSGAVFSNFGTVKSLYGWGSKSIPVANPTLDDGTVYADSGINYGAQGCQVYLNDQTEFVKTLYSIQGIAASSKSDLHSFNVDYVIFLDKDYNQVPFQTSEQTEVAPGVKWPVIKVNSNIKYMTSVLTAGLDSYPLLYTVDGKKLYEQSQGSSTSASSGKSTVSKDVESYVMQAVSGALSDLGKNFPDLSAQFNKHKTALINAFHKGPFKYGNSSLVDAKESVKITQGSSSFEVRLYEGSDASKGLSASLPCYGTSDVADLLLPYDANPSSSQATTVSLPDPSASYFVSMITDVVYKVSKIGTGSKATTTFEAVDFSHVPGSYSNSKLKLQTSKQDSYYWLSFVAGATGASKTDVKNLETYVEQQRAAWFAKFSESTLVQGAKVGSYSIKLAAGLDNQKAEENNCLICQVSPMPSIALTSEDWFIAVSSDSPTLSSLQIVSPTSASAKSMISLVTGVVYDMQGSQRTSGGKAVLVSVGNAKGNQETVGQYLYDYITKAYADKGLTSTFTKAYESALTTYDARANRPISQGMYAGIHIGAYASDLSMGNYVYFDMSGVGSENFVPNDLFVAANPNLPSSKQLGVQFTDDTPLLVSLISGQIYTKSGPRAMMSEAVVASWVHAEKSSWRPWLTDAYDKLHTAYQATQAAEEAELKKLQEESSASDSKVSLNATTVKSYIAALSSDYLPAPYQTLKQNVTTGDYVHLSPADPSDPNKFLYLFFNVPNTYGADGKGVPLGAIYTQDGQLVQELQGAALTAMKDQFGLYGPKAQTLGVPLMQPSLLVGDDNDKLLKAGQNGSSMLVSSSDDFPGMNVKMPANYYLYYNTLMNSYYVLDSKRNQWLSVAGGNVYARNGTPVPVTNKVALSQTNQMILLEKNDGGYMQGILQGKNGSYVDFTNNGDGKWQDKNGNTVSVANTDKKVVPGKPITSYKVTDSSKSITYTVDSAYDWHDLVLLPINTKTGKLLASSAMPSSSYQVARVIKKSGVITNVMFNGVMYASGGSSAGAVMKPILKDSSAPNISVTSGIDTNTTGSYVDIELSGKVYRYGYVYATLDKEQQDSMQLNIFKGAVTTCPVHTGYGPMVSKSVKDSSGSDVTTSYPTGLTYTLFIPNISGGSSKLSSVQMKDVSGMPADMPISAKDEFGNYKISRIFKSANGRFFGRLYQNKLDSSTQQAQNTNQNPYISYFNQDGYVDLQTGALFDYNTGKALGTSLLLKDFLAVLNQLEVTVLEEKGKPGLYYRTPSAIKVQEQQDSSSSSNSGSSTPSSSATSVAKK